MVFFIRTNIYFFLRIWSKIEKKLFYMEYLEAVKKGKKYGAWDAT